ncbi:MAG: TolC family protein [Gammaproteobacteria bacterium]|nr:TolC family protein [Gammaproteobacteria bacterium]
MLVLCGLLNPTAGIAASAITLDEYYTAALQRSETIATQYELIQQAEEHYQQANAALLPTVSGIATYTWQDPLPPSSPQTPTNLSHQPLSKITATQPLFRGMREYAALRQSQDLVDGQKQDYRQARVLLFKDVVRNFYTLLALESDLANFGEEIHLNQEREKDIRARVRIGRSRNSELLNVQSNISTLQAQLQQVLGQQHVARQVLAFQSGLSADTALRDVELPPDKLEPIAEYLANLPLRPDVLATDKRLLAAYEATNIARGGHYPSLDLNGNYYFERPGYLNDSKWDVQLALTIPLYAGGSIQSKLREANSQHSQAILAHSQTLRQAEQEIRSLYQSVSADLNQLSALNDATRLAKKSYQAQVQEYHLGLVTTLDVLQALSSYQQNQRALDRARYTAKSDYLQLLAASNRRALTAVTTP